MQCTRLEKATLVPMRDGKGGPKPDGRTIKAIAIKTPRKRRMT